MAELIIKFVDNNNGGVDIVLESDQAIDSENKQTLTEAQFVGLGLFECIINQGIYSIIKQP